MFGKNLWKLRLLLTIPYLIVGIIIFKAIKDGVVFPWHFWLALVATAVLGSMILDKIQEWPKIKEGLSSDNQE